MRMAPLQPRANRLQLPQLDTSPQFGSPRAVSTRVSSPLASPRNERHNALRNDLWAQLPGPKKVQLEAALRTVARTPGRGIRVALKLKNGTFRYVEVGNLFGRVRTVLYEDPYSSKVDPGSSLGTSSRNRTWPTTLENTRDLLKDMSPLAEVSWDQVALPIPGVPGELPGHGGGSARAIADAD
jgi:hypothetical protein